MRVCSTPGCPTIYPDDQGTRCPEHRKQADQARGTATQRGYTSRGHQAFRTAVLKAHPICTLCGQRQATDADHYPTSRRDLITQGLNPNDPQHGRALCGTCHRRETATHQPGGWHTP